MKRKFFTKMILVYICIVVALALGQVMTVYAGEETLSGTIVVSGNVGASEMQPYIEAFEQKYPQVTVEYHYYDDYEAVMQQKVEEGDYGDVLLVPAFLTEADYAKYLAPLGTYIELSQKYNYMNASKVLGLNVYGIPSTAYLAGIAYNKDVFYQAGISGIPQTIDEFLTALEEIETRTDAIPFYTNYTSDWVLDFWEVFPYLEMTGDPDYKYITFADEHNPFLEGSTHYQVYRMLYDIVKQGLCEDDPHQSDWGKSMRMLNEGEIGCMVVGSWALTRLQEAGDYADSVAFMPFPNNVNGIQYSTIALDYCYGVNRNSSNLDAAKAYVSFMLDESGYALDHQCISIVKTDPYPEIYGDMDNVVTMTNSNTTDDSYNKMYKLSKNLTIDSTEIKRVVNSALGTGSESFDDIMTDWNTRWESQRTSDMTAVEREELFETQTEVQSDSQESGGVTENVIQQDYTVSFSDTETEYLAAKGTVRVGYLEDGAPFQYEEDGEFTGLARSLCNVIVENTGLNMEYAAYEEMSQLLEALQTGEIDMAAGLDQNADYGVRLKYSKEYISTMNVIVKNDTIEADDVEEGRLAAVNDAYESYPNMNASEVKSYATLAEAMCAVDGLEAEYLVTNYYSADYYIREQECANLDVVPLSGTSSICFVYPAESDTRLISICNKCIYGIADETILIMLQEYTMPEASPITLRRFVEANPFMCMAAISIFFVIVIVLGLIYTRERGKNAKKHALDVKRYELLTTLVNEHVFEYDAEADEIRFDSKFEDEFGHDRSVMGELLEQYHRIQANPQEPTQSFQLTDKHGNVQWYRMLAREIRNRDGRLMRSIGKLVNVQKDMEEKLEIQDRAQHDVLTGLYNRRGFAQWYDRMCTASRADVPVTLAVLDLDDFKGVNDTLGHIGGDEALCLLADTIKEIFDEQAGIARYGGDEFMICAFDMTEEEFDRLAAELIRRMNLDFTYQTVTRHLSVSLGAVRVTGRQPFNVLFAQADKVLYEVKNDGKNAYRVVRS